MTQDQADVMRLIMGQTATDSELDLMNALIDLLGGEMKPLRHRYNQSHSHDDADPVWCILNKYGFAVRSPYHILPTRKYHKLFPVVPYKYRHGIVEYFEDFKGTEDEAMNFKV